MSITASSRPGELVLILRSRRASLTASAGRAPQLRGGDRAQGGAAIQHPHSVEGRQPLARVAGQRPASVARGLDTHPEGVLGRGARPQHQRIGDLPALEAPRIGREGELIGAAPRGAVHVHRERIGATRERMVSDVEESETAGPAQEFPRCAGEVIAVQPAHVHGHLAHGLAGVQNIGYSSVAADLAHNLGRLHQPRVGGHPGERDERGAPSGHQIAYGLEIDPAFGGVGRAHDLDAAPPGQREVEDLVRGVIGSAGEDHVPRAQVERGERLAERHRRVLLHGQVRRRGAEESCERGVGAMQRLRTRIGRLVPADLVLQRQMGIDRGAHGRGRERRPGIVQVDQSLATRRVGTPAGECERIGRPGHPSALSISSTPRRHFRSSSCRAAGRSPFRSASPIFECGRLERLTRPRCSR